MIAFFGTGLLGSGFVRAFLRRGEQVQVWNRTPAKAKTLEADGAKPFDDPAAAAKGAARIHLALSDDAAVDDVLERARPGLSSQVVLIDHTTTSPQGTAARVKKWADRGVAFQHAPVFMGPSNALEATGLMYASGDRALFDALSPELTKMTGKLLYAGTQPERAAAMKLLGNLFLMFFTSGMAEMLTLAKALKVSPADAASLFDAFNPGASTVARMKRMLDQPYKDPSWELAMARKDARLMLEAGEAGGAPLQMLPGLAEYMDELIQRGHGHDDWTVLAKDALSPRPA